MALKDHYPKSYGAWAGNEAGRKPDFTRCCESVASGRGSWHSSQCSKPNGHGPDGAYCKIHDPEAVKARQEKSSEARRERLRRWQWDWPWSLHTLAYQQMSTMGDWVSVFDDTAKPYTETHPYSYLLRSGEVQHRTATVSRRRHVLTYRAFKALGWPCWVRESLNVEFSDEVGEGSGSWKGGCIGCGWDIMPGETMEDALRRMETVRKFR